MNIGRFSVRPHQVSDMYTDPTNLPPTTITRYYGSLHLSQRFPNTSFANGFIWLERNCKSRQPTLHMQMMLTIQDDTSSLILSNPSALFDLYPKPLSVPNDVLCQILLHLETPDLARWLRVSRRCFDIAGPLLYGQSVKFDPLGLSCMSWTKRARYFHQTQILEGLAVPAWSAYLGYRPSPFKLALLSHVKHIDFYLHTPSDCANLPRHNFLPSLETLSITHSPLLPPWYPSLAFDWFSNLFTSLRPKKVHIYDMRYHHHLYAPDERLPWHIPLRQLYDTCTESVTFATTSTDYMAKDGTWGITIDWPFCMKLLTMHLMRTEPFDDDEEGGTPERMAAVEGIIHLLASAEHLKSQGQIIGEGSVFGLGTHFSSFEAQTNHSDRSSDFTNFILSGYGNMMKLRGTPKEEIARRLGELKVIRTEGGI